MYFHLFYLVMDGWKSWGSWILEVPSLLVANYHCNAITTYYREVMCSELDTNLIRQSAVIM